MTLTELKTGDVVFIDANVFLYHFAGESEHCKEFLKRCETKDILGVTGPTVLMEVCHKLMVQEAIRRRLVTAQKPTRQFQKKPEIVKKLTEYSAQLLNMISGGIKIIPLPEDALIRSQPLRSQFGLLTSDSLIPVYMASADTNKLATNDRLFSVIPSLHVYAPADLS